MDANRGSDKSIMNRLRHLFTIGTKKKRISHLHRLGIDIVHGCQLRCVGCPNSTLQNKIRYMTVEDFNAILKNIDIISLKRLRLFNFGEPLLHPEILDILLRIPEQTYRIRTVEISTNAQHHDFPMLAEVFRMGVVNQFAVSCDGNGTKDDYERLRPPGKFEKLLEFLIKAKEFRDRYAPDTKLITRTISETQESKKRWTDVLVPLGWTPEFRGWRTLPESVKTQIENKPVILNRGCRYMSKGYLYVDFDGTVVPCCVHPRPFELGNLKENKYSEVLNSDQRKLVLHQLNTKKENMVVCGKCPY